MEISKGILSTGNITGDQLYSAVDTVEELYQKKKATYVGTIMPNRIDLPVALKTAKK